MKKTGTENTESSFKYGLIEKMLTLVLFRIFVAFKSDRSLNDMKAAHVLCSCPLWKY